MRIKRIVIIIILFIAFFFGSVFADGLTKNVTKTIVNEFDVKSNEVVITDINTGDQVITCDLYVDGKRIVTKRIYSMSKIPFDFLAGEIKYLQGKVPDESWDIEPIRLWFKDRQTKDEDGNVSKDDPYYFDGRNTKTTLLERCTDLLENK